MSRILFDQGTPVPLRAELDGHDIETAYERGWSELENGDLLSAAESEGFEILITTDRNLRYQQNPSSRRIAIVVLTSPSWPRIRKVAGDIRIQLVEVHTGSYVEIEIP